MKLSVNNTIVSISIIVVFILFISVIIYLSKYTLKITESFVDIVDEDERVDYNKYPTQAHQVAKVDEEQIAIFAEQIAQETKEASNVDYDIDETTDKTTDETTDESISIDDDKQIKTPHWPIGGIDPTSEKDKAYKETCLGLDIIQKRSCIIANVEPVNDDNTCNYYDGKYHTLDNEGKISDRCRACAPGETILYNHAGLTNHNVSKGRAGVCASCPYGTYSNKRNSISCSRCDKNMIPNSDGTHCVDCHGSECGKLLDNRESDNSIMKKLDNLNKKINNLSEKKVDINDYKQDARVTSEHLDRLNSLNKKINKLADRTVDVLEYEQDIDATSEHLDRLDEATDKHVNEQKELKNMQNKIASNFISFLDAH